MWKFSEQKDDDNTHIACLVYAEGAVIVPRPHIYSGVGYCIVYFCSGLSTTF